MRLTTPIYQILIGTKGEYMLSKLLNPQLLATLCFLMALGSFSAGVGLLCLAFLGWIAGLGAALVAAAIGLMALVYLMSPESESR